MLGVSFLFIFDFVIGIRYLRSCMFEIKKICIFGGDMGYINKIEN